MMISSVSGGGEEADAKIQKAEAALLSFQLSMWDLEDLFSNAEQTEFVIITVPTELASRESIRLLNDLTFESPDLPIKVRNVIANQVLSQDGSDVQSFLERVEKGQADSIEDLTNSIGNIREEKMRPRITKVPFLDTEPRGVYGLKSLSFELTKD